MQEIFAASNDSAHPLRAGSAKVATGGKPRQAQGRTRLHFRALGNSAE
jgi:hypothetical protein